MGSVTISGRPRPQTRSLDVQITNAQMLAVRAEPITLVPSPGANRTTIVERVTAVSDSAGGAWTESTDNLEVRYAAGTVLLTLETTGFIDSGDVQVRHQAPAEAVATPTPNVAVELFNNGDGEFGGGNVANSFSVRVFFRVVDTVAFS